MKRIFSEEEVREAIARTNPGMVAINRFELLKELGL